MPARQEMRRTRRIPASLRLSVILATAGVAGCGLPSHRRDREIVQTRYTAEVAPSPNPRVALLDPIALPLDAPAEWNGPKPVEAYIERALCENRTVQAAFHNVQALRHRIPQVTGLDDPTASNTIFPIPAVAPQYSLMGYNPYNVTLAQAFPWLGTLRLRGDVAEGDVQVALAELAAAQLDTVAAVKRAYADLDASQKVGAILAENRQLLEDFREVARTRLESGGSQQDVLRSEILLSELGREEAANRRAVASARAALARQIHVGPEADLQALADAPPPAAPGAVQGLYHLAIAARPELKGRLAAVLRDEKAVELARKRFYPNVTLGLTYMNMERTNAMSTTAEGMPNVGLFVGFNLPIYRNKYRAGVFEAQERARADAKLFEAQRDEALGEIKDLFEQARAGDDALGLLREESQPRTAQILTLAKSEYAQGSVDYATVISALREVLQVRLQIIQAEAEQSRALASLERAVGSQLVDHPPAAPEAQPIPPEPPPAEAPGPFDRGDDEQPDTL